MPSLNNTVSIYQLKEQLDRRSVRSIDEGFFILDAKYTKDQKPLLNFPTKLDGYLGLFCVSGNLTLTVDMKQYSVTRNSFSVVTPGSLIQLVNNEPEIGCHIIGILLSSENMHKLRFDLSRLFNSAMSPVQRPTIILNKTEISLAIRYYALMREVLKARRPYMRESLLALCSSLVFEVAGSWQGRLSENKETSHSTRPKEIFDRFIALVARYNSKEKSVQFYADKLCITSKYLSKVVKNISGHTPTYWVNSYIIMEAKNMLRYTDYTIKEIVSELNFSNQSVFYKFFKQQTGMTPNEFKNQ